ncbi:MAG: hypothetical protein Q9213_001034 [Squamulea squamosa]
MAAMSIAGSNMESAVAQLKRLQSLSAQGASDFTEPTLLPNPRALEEELSQPRPVSMEVNRHSFETTDSALGKSLSEADVPKQKASTPSSSAHRQMVNGHWHRGKTTSGAQQNTAVIAPKAGKRQGRPRSSEVGENATISDRHDISKQNQYELLPSSIDENQTKKEDTRNKKSRSAIISEAMKASWARRRNQLGTSRQAPSTGKPNKQRSDEVLPGQSRTNRMESKSHGPQRQLFKGQHAIRSGSGHNLPVPASRRHSAAEGIKIHNTLHHVARTVPNTDELAQLPEVSGGPEVHDPPLICKGDTGLTDVFRTCILPTAVASMNRYRDTLPSPELLQAICKKVAKDTINEKFVQFLQQIEYKLDRPQKKLIRKFVKQSFAAAVEAAIEDHQTCIFKAQSTQRKPQTKANALFTAGEAKANCQGHATIVGAPTLHEQESNHGRTDHENALDIHHVNNYIGKPGETEHSEEADEPGAEPSQSEPIERSNIAQPSSDL